MPKLSWLLVFIVAASAHAGELVRSETKHYVLLTDLAGKERRDLERFLEAMHKTYLDVFPGDAVRELEAATVRVFADQAAYNAFGAADGDVGFNQNWRGYYARARHELVSYRGATMADLYSILSHEGFHQFVWEYMVPEGADILPHWYEEGLADYFRSADVRRGKLEHVRKGYHVSRINRAIREGWVWTRVQLWDCDPARITDPLVFDAFYAHAYLFMDFLVAHARKRVKEVYKLKKQGRPSAEIIDEVFPADSRDRLYEAFLRYAQNP